jgi:hypothetical protein
MAKDSPHGTRARWASKCRCDDCNAANARYVRERRNLARGIASESPSSSHATGASVTALPSRLASVAAASQRTAAPPAETVAPGRVEAAVSAEIGQLSARVKHVGLVENALAMARILDDRRLVTTHPSASRQLTASLSKLWSLSVGRSGKLETVAAMAAGARTGTE